MATLSHWRRERIITRCRAGPGKTVVEKPHGDIGAVFAVLKLR